MIALKEETVQGFAVILLKNDWVFDEDKHL